MSDATVTEIRPVSRELNQAATRVAVGINRNRITEGLGFDMSKRGVVEATLSLIQAGQGREALQKLGAKEVENKGLKGGWEDVLKAQIYTDVNEHGQRIARAGTNEVARFNESRATMQIYDEYLQRGYDHLTGTPAEITEKRRVLRDQVRGFLNGNELLRQSLEPLNGGLVSLEDIDRLLRDEEIKVNLAEFLNKIYDPATLKDEKDFFQNAAKLAQVNKGIEHLENERASETAKKTRAETARTNFDTNPTYVGGVTKRVAMDNLEPQFYRSANADVRNLKSNLETKASLEEAKKRHELAGRDVPDALRNRIDNVNVRINNALGDADPATRAAALEYKNLFEERSAIESTIAETAFKIKALEGAIAAKHAEDAGTAVQRAALSKELTTRQKQSGEYSTFVKKALHEVVDKTVTDRAHKFITTYHSERDKQIPQIASEHEDQVNSYLEKRWIYHAKQNFWHQWFERLKINKKVASEDVNVLLGDGPTEFTRRILKSAGIPNDQLEMMLKHGAYKVEHQTIDGKTTLIIGSKTKEMMIKALVAYAASGGKFKGEPDQLETLALSDWGLSTIESIVSGNADFKQTIENLRSHGLAGEKAGEITVSDLLRRNGAKGVLKTITSPIWYPARLSYKAVKQPFRLWKKGAIGMNKLLVGRFPGIKPITPAA